MNAACQKCNKERLTNPVIDTWPLAQAMIPDAKRYNLGSVCRHYGVSYDGEGAHRADYDAEVLSQVLCHMLNEYDSEVTLDDLAVLKNENSYTKVRNYHTTVYAKNKDGLKELFELITLSHTKYLSTETAAGEPRIPRFELEAKRKNGNLLIGSSCQNGEIFDLAHTRDAQMLEEAMDFYDYIELQPLDCYRNLLQMRRRGKAIQNVDDLKKIIGFILDAAKKKNKLVIASSDAHYVHPHQKRVRDIYINAKGHW